MNTALLAAALVAAALLPALTAEEPHHRQHRQ
jgi:hypothetical protein